MFKSLCTYCIIFLAQFSIVEAFDPYVVEQMEAVPCSPALRPYLKTIEQLSEGRQLIAAIQKSGPFAIATNDIRLARQFGAFWDGDERVICISLGAHQSQGEILGSLLFEMYNALASSRLMHLHSKAEAGEIGREAYVRSIEYIEYENSLLTAKIAEQGIAKGLFPAKARLHTYRNFEEHYHFQKVGGHSSWIGHIYDQLKPRAIL